MKKHTFTINDFFKQFPDDSSCLNHLMQVRYGESLDCPKCGKQAFSKQLTAASFQLKGSGYYVTDFKGGPHKTDEGKPEAVKPEAGTETVAMPASTAATPVTSSTT